MNRNDTVIRAQLNIPGGRYRFHIRAVVANGDTTVCGRCGHVNTGLNSFANVDVPLSGSHSYTALTGRYGLAYGDIALFRAHGKVLLYRQVFSQGNIPLAFRPGIECPFCHNVIGHGKVAVPGGQIRIVAGFQPPVLGNDDILSVFTRRIFRVRRFHADIAGGGGGLPVYFNLPVPAFQRDILLRRHGFHIRPVIADPDISFRRLRSYALVLRGYAVPDVYVAFGYRKIYIATRRQVFPDRNAAFLRPHGDGAVHCHIHPKGNIALVGHIHRQVPFRGGVVCYFNIAVVHFQGQVAAGSQLAVLGDHDVLGLLRIPGPQFDIPRFCGGLAVNLDLAVFGSQGHVLVRRHGFHVRAAVADGNVTIFSQGRYAALLRLHLLADGNVAGACFHRHVACYSDIPAKGNIALVIHDDLQVPFGQGAIRYLDAAVIGMQRQVPARIQHAVLFDHDILVIRFVQRLNRDIALPGLGLAVHGNHAVFCPQRHILFRYNRRVIGRVVTHSDIPFTGFDGNAAAGRGDGMDFCSAVSRPFAHGHIAACGCNEYIPAYGDVPAKFHVALVKDCCRKITLRNRIVRNLDIAIVGAQRQVPARNQLAVLVNDKVLRCIVIHILIVGNHCDIALFRFRLAVDGNDAVRYIQVDILFGGNRIAVSQFTDIDIAIIRCHRHAAGIRYYRSLYVRIALPGSDAHIVASPDNTGPVGFANNHGACRRGQLHVAFPGKNFVPYRNLSVHGIAQHAVACGNIRVVKNIALIRQCLHDIAGGHILFILYIPLFCHCYDIVAGNRCAQILYIGILVSFRNVRFNIPAGLYIARKHNKAILRRRRYAAGIRNNFPGNQKSCIFGLQGYITPCADVPCFRIKNFRERIIEQDAAVAAGFCRNILPCVNNAQKQNVPGLAGSGNVAAGVSIAAQADRAASRGNGKIAAGVHRFRRKHCACPRRNQDIVTGFYSPLQLSFAAGIRQLHIILCPHISS